MQQPKTFIIVSDKVPKLKNKGNHIIRDVTHIVQKGKDSADSDNSTDSHISISKSVIEPELLEHILDMEKQVIEIIQTTNNLKIECFKCMDCFKGNKGNKLRSDAKLTAI